MKLILGFSIPLFFGFLFQQFYNLVDTVIVGRFLGKENLAAVGATGSVNFLIIGFCMGVCGGFAIPISHKFGAGDYAGVRRVVANCVWLASGFALVMTVLTTLACRGILTLMRTPANIIDASYSYIWVIFLGIPVTFLYNMTSGVIRAMGDSKTPVIFLVLSSFINIGLDLFFIVNLQWSVQGAAWATVISQGVSGACCLFYIIKKFEILKIQKEEWAPNRHLMGTLCGMGIPMGLQYSITAIGSVILQTAVNTLGSAAVASTAAAAKIGMFFCCPFDAMGSTMATYAGQNVGAGKLGRVSQGIKSTSILGLVYSVLAFGALALFGPTIALLFVDSSETAILQNVSWFLNINSAFFFPLALVNIIRFTIQGLGFSKFAVLAGVCEMGARSIVGMGFVPVFGYVAACFASPVAWVCADIFLVPAYFYVMKKLRHMLKDKEHQESLKKKSRLPELGAVPCTESGAIQQ